MATIINIDNTDFDLNSLFNLQYNFDILKCLIQALAKNQKGMEQKIIDIEDYLNEKHQHSTRVNDRLNSNTQVANQKFKQIEFYIEKREGHEVFSKVNELMPIENEPKFILTDENYIDEDKLSQENNLKKETSQIQVSEEKKKSKSFLQIIDNETTDSKII